MRKWLTLYVRISTLKEICVVQVWSVTTIVGHILLQNTSTPQATERKDRASGKSKMMEHIIAQIVDTMLLKTMKAEKYAELLAPIVEQKCEVNDMARYIDAEKCAKTIRDKCNVPLGYALSLLAEIPTADVVPRSEVEQAKQEVAREIIEHFVNKKNELLKFKYHQDIKDYWLQKLEFWEYIDNFVGLTGEEILAELKKKYIGE